MEKQAIGSQRKASFVRWWNMVIALLVVGLIVGSWAIIAQMARKQQPSPAGTKVVMSNGATQDVYTAYNNVVYKFNGNHDSVLWQFSLKQAYQPDRRIGSYLQLAVVNHVVYAAIEYGIYALDATTGKQIWHYAPQLTPAALAQDRGRIAEIYVDQSVMYLEMTRGDMAALDLQTGALKWSNLSFPNGGSFSASGDTFYASEFSTKQIPILHAIDGMTGKERWHFERQLINTSLSSPFIFDGVVYSSGNPLYALDAHTGKKLWEQRLPMGPAYFDDLHLRNGVLYVNTDAVIALAGGVAVPPDYYHVFAFDAQTGKQLWESQAGYRLRDEGMDGGKSVLVETVVQKQDSLQALDAATGAQRWQRTLDASCDPPGPCSTQIATSDKYFYVLTKKKLYTLQIFDTHTGQQVGHYQVAIPVKEGLDLSTLGNGMLYVRTVQHQGDAYSSGSSTSFTHYVIYAINLTNGATNWKYDIGALLDVQVPITELILAP